VCLHKADERIPAVSAASIISKVERDRIVGEIARIYGNVGSGYPSDPVTIEFLRKAISAGSDLSKIVRVRWETYRRLKEEVETRRLL
jgi:ribonuclease HII